MAAPQALSHGTAALQYAAAPWLGTTALEDSLLFEVRDLTVYNFELRLLNIFVKKCLTHALISVVHYNTLQQKHFCFIEVKLVFQEIFQYFVCYLTAISALDTPS